MLRRLVFALVAVASPAFADTPSQIVDKVKRENPKMIADATLQGTTLKVGHRNPRGNMDGLARVLCEETPREVRRVQVYDIREVMKGEWKTLGASDCKR